MRPFNCTSKTRYERELVFIAQQIIMDTYIYKVLRSREIIAAVVVASLNCDGVRNDSLVQTSRMRKCVFPLNSALLANVNESELCARSEISHLNRIQ